MEQGIPPGIKAPFGALIHTSGPVDCSLLGPPTAQNSPLFWPKKPRFGGQKNFFAVGKNFCALITSPTPSGQIFRVDKRNFGFKLPRSKRIFPLRRSSQPHSVAMVATEQVGPGGAANTPGPWPQHCMRVCSMSHRTKSAPGPQTEHHSTPKASPHGLPTEAIVSGVILWTHGLVIIPLCLILAVRCLALGHLTGSLLGLVGALSWVGLLLAWTRDALRK
jgi:hypothetical protein